MTQTTVHLLYVGTYEDRLVVGVFTARELAEAEIVARAFRGDRLDDVEIVEMGVDGASVAE